MNENLSSIQLAVLDNLKLFDKICRENGLRYFAAGGTALGTVRHQGFVPWDDDADIAMPRADYEKLKEVKLPEGIVLKNRIDTLQCAIFMNTHKKIRSEIREDAHNTEFEYVSVDVHPMDGAPSNKFKRAIHTYLWLYYLMMARISDIDKVVERNSVLKKNRKKWEAAMIKIAYSLRNVFPVNQEKAKTRFCNHIRKYDYDESDYVACYVGRYRKKEVVPKEAFGNGKDAPFEDMMIMAGEHPEIYLSSIYGDFMTLPPDSQRECHNFDYVEDC